MKHFVSVKTKDEQILYQDKPFDSLEAALNHVSENYLPNPPFPWRFAGYFALRDGEITWLKIKTR